MNVQARHTADAEHSHAPDLVVAALFIYCCRYLFGCGCYSPLCPLSSLFVGDLIYSLLYIVPLFFDIFVGAGLWLSSIVRLLKQKSLLFVFLFDAGLYCPLLTASTSTVGCLLL